MTERFNSSGRPVVTAEIQTGIMPIWQLPLLDRFLSMDTDGTRDGTVLHFQLKNRNILDLSISEMFMLRGHACADLPRHRRAQEALSKAFSRVSEAGLLTVDIQFPGQIPAFD